MLFKTACRDLTLSRIRQMFHKEQHICFYCCLSCVTVAKNSEVNLKHALRCHIHTNTFILNADSSSRHYFHCEGLSYFQQFQGFVKAGLPTRQSGQLPICHLVCSHLTDCTFVLNFRRCTSTA